MKKLVKFLLPLISLLFIINVKADITFTPMTYTPLQNCINSGVCNNENDFWNNILNYNNLIQEDSNFEYYTIYYQFSNSRLYYIRSNNQLNVATDSSPYSLYIRNSSPIKYLELGFSFNSNGNITGVQNFGDSSYNGNTYFGLTDSLNHTIGIILATNQNNYKYTTPTWQTFSFSITGSGTYNYQDNIPINFLNGNIYNWSVKNLWSEPTYSYEETILENGNVKLDFTFSNYSSDSGYAFEIENGISNEEYGITNTYSNIFPNQIPFGSNYSIELPFDTYLYITLAKYEQVENTSLYYREEIYTHIIDINNIAFENKQDPYFVIYNQNKNLIEGSFANTTNQNTCWYRYSTSQNEDFVPCDELLGLSFYDNGYVEVIIKKGSQTVYSRKINYLGSNQNEPYIKYEVVKQDFYSIVNWSTENYVNNLTFRYSVDNGNNFTTWSIYNNNQNYYINVFDNSTIIIEIANSDQSTIYDSKAIIVVNDINTIKNINNTTTNFIDKFRSMFSVNGNILSNVNNFYDNIKLSKVYLLIFIPFLTSLIAGIIYLIRRK